MSAVSERHAGPIQHMIPRQYLRGFAHSPARTHVWVYTKGQPYATKRKGRIKPNPSLAAIKKAGAARGAYRLVTLAGERIDADPTISQQELWGVEVLSKLRTREPISEDDKARFSLYIDLMRARVSAGAAHARPFVRKAMEGFGWAPLRSKANAEGREDLVRKFDPRIPESVAAIERELLLRGVIERSPMIVRQLVLMRWRFLTVDGDRFFPTTDNPAFFPPERRLVQPDGLVLMPIDSQTVLLVCNLPVPDRRYVPATAEEYTHCRTMILRGATEKAYADRNDPDVLATLDSQQQQ